MSKPGMPEQPENAEVPEEAPAVPGGIELSIEQLLPKAHFAMPNL